MNVGRFPWLIAKVNEETSFKAYSQHPQRLISKLPAESRPIIRKILEIVPEKRATIKDILDDKWFKNIECCASDHKSTGHTHHLIANSF